MSPYALAERGATAEEGNIDDAPIFTSRLDILSDHLPVLTDKMSVLLALYSCI